MKRLLRYVSFALIGLDERTLLRITERGFIDQPLFRFLARFVFGLHGSQQTYLEDLSHHLGEKSRPRREI